MPQPKNTRTEGTDQVLKKLFMVSAVTATAVLGVAGVAYASDNSPDCSSQEETEQINEGDQAFGGNGNVQDLNGFIGGQIDKSSFCPSAFNDNEKD